MFMCSVEIVFLFSFVYLLWLKLDSTAVRKEEGWICSVCCLADIENEFRFGFYCPFTGELCRIFT